MSTGCWCGRSQPKATQNFWKWKNSFGVGCFFFGFFFFAATPSFSQCCFSWEMRWPWKMGHHLPQDQGLSPSTLAGGFDATEEHLLLLLTSSVLKMYFFVFYLSVSAASSWNSPRWCQTKDPNFCNLYGEKNILWAHTQMDGRVLLFFLTEKPL